MAMKFLYHLINEKVNSKEWLPFKFKNKEPKLSHLLFADDVLLFEKANRNSIYAMHIVLDKF